MADDVLSDRVLNRTLLARQLLLDRVPMDPVDAVHHLVGLQAQVPTDPYTALWSRLAGFDPAVVSTGLAERRLVRIVVLRGTIHLVTAADALGLRPLLQPVLDAELARHPDAKDGLEGVDLTAPLAFVWDATARTPLSGSALRAAVADRFPDLPAEALSIAARCKLPMVQVPPRGLWRTGGQVRSTPADSWLGRPLQAFAIDDVVLRYLTAFGPATPADATAWSRLPALREVFERLRSRSRLRVFRDERGRELFDVGDDDRSVVVAADVPAPVRFLPEYDNVLLSHADRSRIVDRAAVEPIYPDRNPGRGHVLVDGMLRATWKLPRDDTSGTATLTVLHLQLTKKATAAVEAEARRLLRFLAPDTREREVVLTVAT